MTTAVTIEQALDITAIEGSTVWFTNRSQGLAWTTGELVRMGTEPIALRHALLVEALGPAFTDAQEIKLLFNNLMGTPASPADVAYWQHQLDTGVYTQDSLATMAAHCIFNKILLTGLVANDAVVITQ